MQSAARRPAADGQPVAQPTPPRASACQGGGCAQPPCCQQPAGVEEDGRPRSLADSAAGGSGGVSRRSDVAGGAARAAAPASAEIEPTVQQQPGSAPCTPEAPCEAAAVAELWCRAAGQAGDGQAPTATSEAGSTPAAAKAALRVASLDRHTLRRVHSFVHCVAGSALVQSALLHLEHEGEHPPAMPASLAAAGPAGRGAAAGLEWTLAQLLALWLRAGHQHARESALLGALWVLEAAHSAWRSPASVVLPTYTKLVGAVSSEVAKCLTADWPASFAKLKGSLVEAQMELLQRTGWRVRLDWAADVLPCHALLFSPELLGSAQLGPGQQQQAQHAPPPADAACGTAPQEWAAGMRRLCAAIRETSRRLKAHEQARSASSARLPTPECEDEGPAKRQRSSAA